MVLSIKKISVAIRGGNNKMVLADEIFDQKVERMKGMFLELNTKKKITKPKNYHDELKSLLDLTNEINEQQLNQEEIKLLNKNTEEIQKIPLKIEKDDAILLDDNGKETAFLIPNPNAYIKKIDLLEQRKLIYFGVFDRIVRERAGR